MEYDVHFKLTGFYKITAHSEEQARIIVEDIIDSHIGELEHVLCTGIKDDTYVTEVITV